MRKNLTVAVLAALFVVAGATLAFAHHGPVDVTIGEAAKKQPPVPFPHGKHATSLVKSCDTCHHTDKGLTTGTDKDVKKCAACHLDPKGDVPSMREMSMTKNPFHIRCIGCHKTEKDKKAPTTCPACHKK